MDDSWQTIQALFRQACDLPAQEQAALLSGLPEDIATQLSSLLASDRADDNAIMGVGEQAQQLLAPQRAAIGPYRVIERVGTGGMGAVYLCEREADYQQRVAVKIVPTIFENPEMLQRFRAERQMLANLDHPNIARLLDGGTTEDGLPYLVMEYVLGVPISAYCLGNKLYTAARLKL